ncbi:MAG TPA: methionyl-tRNA formyltransferase [Phycisphaerales bacterium]|nr:methionyl-tRNA formyltransferase [Phycisphaerales bacterium]HMP38139.1 methionyl-tRNA formyltransferase [Phycisphaerales bacterium]
MRLVFFGSGSFGLPTLEALAATEEIALVVTQPDRPAGRGRALAPTPVAEWAERRGVRTLKAASVHEAAAVEAIHAVAAEAWVVIAFGQKLAPHLLGETFAINLHGSLLPRHRGAAPVNWTILAGDGVAGVSVITLAQRMDAGGVLLRRELAPLRTETAGELHDRLAALGPGAIAETLRRFRAGTLSPEPQDDRLATKAPKLGRADAWVDFRGSAENARRRINALAPWPGVSVRLCERDRVDETGQMSATGCDSAAGAPPEADPTSGLEADSGSTPGAAPDSSPGTVSGQGRSSGRSLTARGEARSASGAGRSAVELKLLRADAVGEGVAAWASKGGDRGGAEDPRRGESRRVVPDAPTERPAPGGAGEAKAPAGSGGSVGSGEPDGLGGLAGLAGLGDRAELGTIDERGWVRCGGGWLVLLEVQPVGGRAMAFGDFLRGRRSIVGMRLESIVEPPGRE